MIGRRQRQEPPKTRFAYTIVVVTKDAGVHLEEPPDVQHHLMRQEVDKAIEYVAALPYVLEAYIERSR
jgi:type III secretion system FlhB-like substrate exporter